MERTVTATEAGVIHWLLDHAAMGDEHPARHALSANCAWWAAAIAGVRIWPVSRMARKPD